MRLFNLGADDWDFQRDRAGWPLGGTRVGDRIGGDGIGASLYELGDGQRTFPYHYHHGVEEWLLVVDGTPTVRTPEGERELRRGDVICFPKGPEGAHAVRGPGRVLVLSANRRPEVVAYPDSDKLGTRPQHEPDVLNFRRSDAVDYWEGE